MRNLHFVTVFAFLSLLSTQGPGRALAGDREGVDGGGEVRVRESCECGLKLDGIVLTTDSLAGGVRLDGIEVTYDCSGPVPPVLEIDGEVYVLAGERLIRMEDAAPNRANVYFLGQPEMNARVAPVTRAGAAMAPSPVLDDDLEQAGEQAYLRQLSFRDRTLFNQIQREQSVELETFRLAGEYRRANDPDDQSRIEDALRDKLGESFELKQQIRADEIAQAETQISELRGLLDERSTRKDQIIERRLLELIGKRGH